MQPFMKNALLSTHELKNVLMCLGEHLMCSPSCCRPLPSSILGEVIEKTFKMLLWQCQALLSSYLLLKPLDD